MSLSQAIREKISDSKDLDSLARLPQALIIQMGQREELTPEEVTLIIGKKGQQIEDAAQRRALAQVSQQPMPSVMEQKMMQIAQAENPAPEPQMQPQMMAQAPMPQLPEDVGIAQNPTPPMQMAGGGIIAFSGEDGSYVEEDDDDETDALIFGLLQKMRSSSGRATPSVGIASGYEDREERSGDMVDRLRAQIMAKESGGRRYDKEGNLLTSSKGAKGEMQVMPYTSRDPGFGIRPARDGSPEELRRVGDEYAAAMYNRYGDPKLAMIAYNMGPGATDKWLASGADVRRLPKETQGYIRGVSLAEGGEVKHFQDGGTMGGFSDENYSMDALRIQEAEAAKKRKEYEDKYNFLKESAPNVAAGMKPPVVADTANKAPVSVKPPKSSDKKIDEEGVQNLIAAKKEELTPEQELFNEIRADVRARKAALAEDRKMDKWRAGLIAGAKMMQNTSPYFLTGLGSGAEAGAQSLSESKKLRAAEEAGIATGMGSLYKNQIISKLKDAQLADTKAYRDEKLNAERTKAVEAAVDRALKLQANAQQQNLLNAYEMQFSRGTLDKSKIPELERLRTWRANLEAGIRNRMMAPGGGGSGGYTPTQTQAAALDKYS